MDPRPPHGVDMWSRSGAGVGVLTLIGGHAEHLIGDGCLFTA